MESTLYQIFKESYNRDSFEKNVLTPIFNKSVKDYIIYNKEGEQEVELTDTEKRTAKKVVKYGEFKTHDNRKIELYEVTVEDFRQVKIARVGLGALVKKLIIGNNAVFATFKYEDVTDKHWRFSFIAYDSFFEDGQVQTKETNPKRYTYVFGDTEETYRTAIDRFQELDSKFQIKVKDIQEAFAVEAMSKEFFDEYRETHYAKFVKYLTGEEFQKKAGKYELIKVQNPSPFLDSVFDGDKKDARDFCKKLLGQIVFLYFIQKKGWLGATNTNYKEGNGDKNFIQNFYRQAGENDNFYPLWLSKLFYDTLNQKRDNDDFEMPDGSIVKIPYLNGGLFEKESDKFDYLTFPSELFTDLFEFFNRFNFTIYENSPEEHTVAVDPEMLGHIFENLLEDNKDKGAFYTPKEIVQYMTQESLIEYLVTHIGDNAKDGISLFVKQKNKEYLTEDQLKKIDGYLDDVKICDPAIGSGAFPMGLLQEIFALKERIAFDLGFKVWSPATVKENIIQNSIYGVDIEKGAVDIAQLRFWLSLIVDEEEPKPLPNLAYKIVVGNSLVSKFGDEIIEIDWEVDEGTQSNLFGNPYQEEIQKLLKQISEKQKEYFSANNNNKTTLSKEIRLLKLEILSKQLELMITTNGFEKIGTHRLSKAQTERWLETEGWKRTLQKINTLKINNKPFEHFDWRLDFPEILNPIVNENTGFDIIIGNPPYIKEATKKSAFDGFRNSKYYQGKMDIWYGFACESLDLLKEKGVECFIATNNWITNDGASILRKKVLLETEILKFVDFNDYKVFKSAGIQTMIMVLKNNPVSIQKTLFKKLKNSRISNTDLVAFLSNLKTTKDFDVFYSNINVDENQDNTISFLDEEVSRVLSLINDKSNFKLVSEEVLSGIDIPQDFLNKKNKEKLGEGFEVGMGVFVLSDYEANNLNLNETEWEILKPYYTTSELIRYYGDKQNKYWIIYTDSSYKDPSSLNNMPNLKKHLDSLQEIITSENKPYGLNRARKDGVSFIGEKIVVKRKCPDSPTFTYTNFDTYFNRTFMQIVTERIDNKFLCSILNSNLVKFFLFFKGKMQGTNYQLDKSPLLEIPLIITDEVDKFKILVDYIIFLISNKGTGSKLMSIYFEQIIDGMVYELYFPELLKENKRTIIEHLGDLPAFSNSMSNSHKEEIVESVFKRLDDKDHPVRNNLFYMRNIEEIAVIEGLKE
ncbi:Eco57I restriction-modification methylase domain-containing protein [Neptunitalea lumnitzerae]|uniref:site-specific DNA-methyltransferase (adenine-specific) n=1 Tax=Neptunitalea lumnitzerae TaxID=2965509 RepID=A0ABQ5MFK3_9FLAO|nr:N-6 DNA methylase [Neptunitalea sp. Y10]GLB47697.1 hypothetical protein Y10_00650 [Neptunitalea sp. Y10]